MSVSTLPPAGNRVLYQPSLVSPPSFPGYHAIWVNSGTAALSVALILAKAQAHSVELPEVIIPAYCCPDLVAAAVYAGVKPVAVDIGPNDSGYLLDSLKVAVGQNTIAIIAINFLGIRDRLEEIKGLLDDRVLLIEDNAQWYPEVDDSSPLVGDIVISSFGRGKPASILGGGVLLLKQGLLEVAKARSIPLEAMATARVVIDHGGQGSISKVREWAKVFLYNTLRHPLLYHWLLKLPFLQLGETRYHAITEIRAMPLIKQRQLDANVQAYQNRSLDIERWYDEFDFDSVGMIAIGKRFPDRRKRLLRYPVLCRSPEQRERVLNKLIEKGLGATSMYRQPLLGIEGMDGKAKKFGDHSNAEDFASRFFTLPIHDLVTSAKIQAIKAILSE